MYTIVYGIYDKEIIVSKSANDLVISRRLCGFIRLTKEIHLLHNGIQHAIAHTQCTCSLRADGGAQQWNPENGTKISLGEMKNCYKKSYMGRANQSCRCEY